MSRRTVNRSRATPRKFSKDKALWIALICTVATAIAGVVFVVRWRSDQATSACPRFVVDPDLKNPDIAALYAARAANDKKKISDLNLRAEAWRSQVVYQVRPSYN